MGLLTALSNMQRENRRYYLMSHDSTDFTIAEIEEVIEYLGRDSHEDFRNDEDKMWMYIKERYGCYT